MEDIDMVIYIFNQAVVTERIYIEMLYYVLIFLEKHCLSAAVTEQVLHKAFLKTEFGVKYVRSSCGNTTVHFCMQSQAYDLGGSLCVRSP